MSDSSGHSLRSSSAGDANVVAPAQATPVRSTGLSTGFVALDQLLGASGIPLRAVTVLAGTTTSGKVTLAYKILSQAQQSASMEQPASVALLDLGASTDPDYVARCGVDLSRLLLVRPQDAKQTLRVLLDLVRSREVRAILVDGLFDLRVDRESALALEERMPQVNLALKSAPCALVLLDEPQPIWQPWLPGSTSRAVSHYAALRIELAHAGWIETGGELAGYRAHARLVKSRGPRGGSVASIAIEFHQTVRARETW